jgi:glutaconyl-CoA/methylmalonyl-CoA decarboxylase subunit gamma
MRFNLQAGTGSRLTYHQLEIQTIDSTVLVPGKLRFTLDGEAAEANCAEVALGIYSIIIDGRSYEVFISSPLGPAAGGPSGHEGTYVPTVRGRSYRVQVLDPRRWRRADSLGAGDGPQEVLAPMPGKIVKVLVAEGQQVGAGDGLLVIEAMKMQNEIRASRSGRVDKIYVSEGAGVETGFKLVRLA